MYHYFLQVEFEDKKIKDFAEFKASGIAPLGQAPILEVIMCVFVILTVDTRTANILTKKKFYQCSISAEKNLYSTKLSFLSLHYI